MPKQKWVYEIRCRNNVTQDDYLIWSYSSHFNPEQKLSNRQKRRLKRKGHTTIAHFMGTAHSATAVGWILGLQRDLKKWNALDNFDHEIVKDGLFNPHFRLNKVMYPPIWLNPKDVEIYFTMHLYDAGDKSNEDNSTSQD